MAEAGQVSDDEHPGMSRHREIGLHHHPAGAIDAGPKVAADGGGRHAGSPQDGVGGEALAAHRDRPGFDRRHRLPFADHHAQVLQCAAGRPAQAFRKRREDGRAALE